MMASTLGQRHLCSSEQGHASIAIPHGRRRLVCLAQRQTNVEQRWIENGAHFTPAVAVSLAAASLLCFTDTALAVQGGLLEEFGVSPSSGGKVGVQFAEPKVKVTPSAPPKIEAPKPAAKPAPVPKPKAEKKTAQPAKKPAAKETPAKAPGEKLELPKETKKGVSGQKPTAKPSRPKAVTKTPPPPKAATPKLELPKPTKPAPSKKEPSKPSPSLPSLPTGISAPSISLPTLSGSSSGATQAAVLVGIEVVLALIATSTVNSLLKKA